jgi:hypothetical protein
VRDHPVQGTLTTTLTETALRRPTGCSQSTIRLRTPGASAVPGRHDEVRRALPSKTGPGPSTLGAGPEGIDTVTLPERASLLPYVDGAATEGGLHHLGTGMRGEPAVDREGTSAL